MSMDDGGNPFARKTVIFGIAASLIAAFLFFLLASYAPNVASNIGVTATPTSSSAVGYSGFVRLMEKAGPKTETLSRTDELGRKGLLIVFVDATDQPDALTQIVELRPGEPTLFVLPKWFAQPIGLDRNRVQSIGTLDGERLDALLAPIAPGRIAQRKGGGRGVVAGMAVRLPKHLHMARDDFHARDGYPSGLLIEAEDQPHWVLTDPDFINNAGIDDLANTRAMFAMIDDLRYTGDDLLIATPRLADAGGRNLGKLLLDPPFLPLTIILLFAGLLALLHGFARFGPVTSRARVFAFGKGALVETTADLLRRAGKISGLGPRYADTMRRRAGERLGAPASLSGERLADWLDRRARVGSAGDTQSFTQRADVVSAATSEEELHRRARALASWIEGIR